MLSEQEIIESGVLHLMPWQEKCISASQALESFKNSLIEKYYIRSRSRLLAQDNISDDYKNHLVKMPPWQLVETVLNKEECRRYFHLKRTYESAYEKISMELREFLSLNKMPVDDGHETGFDMPSGLIISEKIMYRLSRDMAHAPKVVDADTARWTKLISEMIQAIDPGKGGRG
jgi:hypothetical protein